MNELYVSAVLNKSSEIKALAPASTATDFFGCQWTAAAEAMILTGIMHLLADTLRMSGIDYRA
jgi:hypothetical protein